MLKVFVRQFNNPLLLILFIATLTSFFLGERINSLVILGIMALSVALGFFNEYAAEKTVRDLLKKVSLYAVVIRNGQKEEVPANNVKAGDMVWLFRGSVVPADIKLTQVSGLEVDESALTGESFPVTKQTGDKANMGTIITSGTGEGRVVAVGRDTSFGKISEDVSKPKSQTQFEKGLAQFGTLLVRVIVIMAIVIFIVNAVLGHQPIISLLFALSIAVGLTPELLPVIVTVSLSYGAKHLAKKEVVVKQLVAIEDLGNMEVLCTDKTGTLTEGKINLESFDSEEVLKYALIANSAIVSHRIFGDSIDCAIWEYARTKISNFQFPISKKIQEEPFDYDHKAMFTVIEENNKRLFLYKGAPEEVLAVCNLSAKEKSQQFSRFKELSAKGLRVVAVAKKEVIKKNSYSFSDADNLSFCGYLCFFDKPKVTAKVALERLEKLGVKVKILTGDSQETTDAVCLQIGLTEHKIIPGSQLDLLTEEKLRKVVWETDAFVRVTPEQKLRIIKALQYGGHTVGYMGDGINDAPALHTADVGISVNSGVDVARDTASVVLLRKSLNVIAEGVLGGRKIFANTFKYVLMGTSSNFGNMFSAAGASFLLPFLPMLPSQILLTNALYDLSQVMIPTDNVDSEVLSTPRRWNVSQIRRYMLFFGPISSIYDFATFGMMLYLFHAKDNLFQTGWFVESLVTEIMVVFAIRTMRPFWKSKPSALLLSSCFLIVILGLLIPYSPLSSLFSFTPLPALYFFFLIILTLTYLIIVEFSKKYLSSNLSN